MNVRAEKTATYANLQFNCAPACNMTRGHVVYFANLYMSGFFRLRTQMTLDL